MRRGVIRRDISSIDEDQPQVAQGVLSTADLKASTGYQRSRDLERCLTAAGVRWFPGKDGPWTTIDLINAAGGLVAANQPDEPYPTDIL